MLFLCVGMAFATDNTTTNDDGVIGDNLIGDKSVDEDITSVNAIVDSQEIGEGLDEVEIDSAEFYDDENVLSDQEYINPDSDDSQDKFIRNGSVILVWSTKFEYIQAAIDYANENDTIILHCSSIGNGSQIIVNKSLTIEGEYESITLDANGQSRIFCILSDNVAIKNLRMINGFQNDTTPDDIIYLDSPTPTEDSNLKGTGAAIKWVGNNGSLINCILTENYLLTYRPSDGKVVSWIGENGKIIDSYFVYNHFDSINHVIGVSFESDVIDRFVHGSYYGDLEGNVLFMNVILNSKPVLELENISTYYQSGEKVSFHLGANGVNFANEIVNIIISRGEYIKGFNVTTDSNGLIKFNIPNDLGIGKYSIKVKYMYDGNVAITAGSYLSVHKVPAKISSSAYSAIYNSGKLFKARLINSRTNKALVNTKLNLKVYTGNVYKSYKLTTDKNGYVSLDLSKLAPGKHKVVFSGDSTLSLSKTSSIDIVKRNTIVKLAKTSFRFKKSDYLRMTVTDKLSKKPVKGAVVIVKVYTGSKFKTYNLKTNSRGLVRINTGNLNKGTHKISLGSNSKYYKIIENTYIKVK